MAIATFKDLCIDTTGGMVLARFWAAALGLDLEPDDTGVRVAARLGGPTPQHGIWMNVVPEPRTVKQRVHLDVHTDSVDTLVRLGASVLEKAEGWTVMADPEGGELCAFERAEVPGYRLYEVVVDCAEPAAVGKWWGEVLDAPVQYDSEQGWSALEPVPGAPFECMVFVPVPERKTVKNRIHWDVDVADLQPLLDHGAVVVRPSGGDIGWHVLADPEGNEFCAFVEPDRATA
jgi:catechol 2,3-dioxygenase-like lactoylglutathione lyase family enzyme